MTEKRPGRSLTRREFDAVIRRAAELSGSDAGGSEGQLSEGELFRIAGEVGLSDSHVRRALAEVRSGEVGGNRLDRWFGPGVVIASRVVPGTVGEIGQQLDDFLVATQLLQPVRRGGTVLQYRPAVDWTSQLARAASFSSRKYYIASAKSVEVRLERVDDERTLVEFSVDPGTRNEHLAGAVFGGGAAGVSAGVVVGAIVTSTAGPVVLGIAAGTAVGSALWSGIAIGTARSHHKKVTDVRSEVEGVLDALEHGVSLEPPPPSWRRWVKRNFHGVARDLMGREEQT
jgi:hypothetical protein